jgi:mono/diheme cytochrome c family protein
VKTNKYYIGVIILCLGIIAVVLLVNRGNQEAYLVQGKKSYEKHCANCHGAKGEGLQLLIPPLNDAHWVNNDSIICLIKNGLDGPIRVNGKDYNSRMPGNPKIENDEIANLVSYIRHEFTQKPTRLTLKTVREKVLTCQ